MQYIADELRRSVFRTICRAGGGHIAGSLSAVEILTVLYHGVMNTEAGKPDDPGRDRFVLSKGHAAVALYAVLTQKGFLDEETLTLFAVQKLSDDNTADDLPQTAIVKKWWAYMADIMDTNPDNSPVCKPLREVFHQD